MCKTDENAKFMWIKWLKLDVKKDKNAGYLFFLQEPDFENKLVFIRVLVN